MVRAVRKKIVRKLVDDVLDGFDIKRTTSTHHTNRIN
jgi:hypothetical protein